MKKIYFLTKSLMILFVFVFLSNSYAQKTDFSKVPGKLEATNNSKVFVNQSNNGGNPTTDQVNVYVLPDNASTSGNSRAPQGNQRYIRTAYIISAAEMQAASFPAGLIINAIGFNYQAAQNVATTGSFKVYLQNTSDVAYSKPTTTWTNGSNGVIDGMTLVHDNNITIPASTGIFDIPFVNGSSFTYTGGALYVAFEYQNPSPGTIATTGNVAWCSNVLVGGSNGLRNAFSTTTLPTTLANTSNFRPGTRLGSASLIDIAEVVQLYVLGKTPTPFGNPTPISGIVKNNSASNATFYATLTVFDSASGAVRYKDSIQVVDLAPSAQQTVNFPNWSPSLIERDSILLSVVPQPGENWLVNNSMKRIQNVNINSYSYAQGLVPTGGVGFTGGTGDFVAKFPVAGHNSINQINVNFSAGGQPFQIGIWDASGVGGTPGTNLYTSSSMTSAVGVFTVLVNPPIDVTDNFYVGVRQTGTTNVSFSYQTETPIRPSTFYFASPTGSTTWNDFAPANPFRFMIEPRFALNNDVGATAINQGGTSYYPPGTTNIQMTGQVTNFGILSATFDVNRKIYNGNTIVYDNNATVNNLASNGVANTTFPDFTGFTAGQLYTIVDSTKLGTDQNVDNNRFSRTFTPNVAKTMAVVWTDAASRDSLVAQLNANGYNSDYDLIDGTTFTGSFSAWRTVFYLLASTGNWTTAIRDSLKSYLDNSSIGPNKKTLLIFGNDLGYNNDPIRNTTAPAADTLFYRQYLGATYMEDSWIDEVPTAGSKIYGTGGFSSIVSDSVADPFPDMIRPSVSNPEGTRSVAFLPLTVSGPDSVAALSYVGDYNLFYGTNMYASFRTKIGAGDNPGNIFNALKVFIESNGGALPVELASFTSSVTRNDVYLKWSTVSEINNSGFDIERKLVGTDSWLKVGNVEGAGNSSELKNYLFSNTGLQTGKYNYRLKQIDFNGNYEYHNLSGEVIVGVPGKFDLSQNYPNPFNPATKINYDIPFDGKVSLAIFDVSGREVAKLVNEIQPAGYYTVQLNGVNLSSGVYFYRIISEGNAGQQFIMTKKMVLVK